MQTTATAVRSPRVVRKAMMHFPDALVNLTTTATTTSTPAAAFTSEYRSTSTRPMRETLVLGLSFFFVYTSFQAIQNLQTSLHHKDGLGVVSLTSVYGAVFVSSFFTPAIIYHMGVKASIMAAWGAHCLFVICNFFSSWLTIISGSLVLGAFNCPLWTSLEIYMTSLARQEMADPKKQTTFHAAFSRLNRAFFSIFMGSHVLGNIISSTILFQSSYNESHSAGPLAYSDHTKVKQCGTQFCPAYRQQRTQLATPDPVIIYALLSVYLLFEVCGLVTTACYLPDLQQPRWTGQDVRRKLKTHLQSLTQARLWLLVPFLISRMMNLAIEVGTFTQAFISCTLGIRMVGYVMSSWGLATMLSAALLGWLARYTGRQVLCISALVVDGIIFAVLMYWNPQPDDLSVFFFLAVLMGLVEGVWAVQINALIAAVFPLTADSAFAVKGMWGSLAMAVTFVMTSFLCPSSRLLVAACITIIALFSYIALECTHLR